MSMTVLKVSATQGIVTNKIGSRAYISGACLWSTVVWISIRRRGTEFNLCSRYNSRSLPTMLGMSLSTKINHSSRVFSYKLDSGNPITTFSVSNLQSIAMAATEVKVFPIPISSATSAPTISASQTHLLTMTQMAQTWCTRYLVPGRNGIDYLWPGTWSSGDWRTGQAFSSLTVSSRPWCANLLLMVLSTVLNTGLLLSGSRTTMRSCTSSRTSLEPWLVNIFVLNDVCQLLRGKLGRLADTKALLKFIAMLGISQTSIRTQ